MCLNLLSFCYECFNFTFNNINNIQSAHGSGNNGINQKSIWNVNQELNSIEATYQSDVNAAIAKQKAALAANPKLVMVFNATFKSEMSAAQSKKDAAIVASRIKRASEVAKAGIALIWP
jgi:hypothetical protein